ncbi:hypothetical protein [Falsiroseomonas oryzae]|uniref:hypothetical protein n=1 Tax=Falsiroseomonas oryzae TaxID=2766473 RepID=UPI0022EAA684|nr:hypothetical protein [Roseomonas sp. MO-31]
MQAPDAKARQEKQTQMMHGGVTERPTIARLPAGEIEAAVVAQVRALLRQPEMVAGPGGRRAPRRRR